MFLWALFFLIVGLVAAALGFTDVAAGVTVVAKILFLAFFVLFLLSIAAGLYRRAGRHL